MKKILTYITTAMVALCLSVSAEPIYTYREDIPISDSIALTKIEEFHSDHNLSYSYIKADLSDENTSLKLLTSNEGTDILDTVQNLAQTDKNTVAALNADFFSVFSGNKGFSLGIQIQDGVLTQSPINPDTMATVSYDENGAVSMSYLEFEINVVAPSGNKHKIRHLNKHTTYFGDILMYTSTFNGGMSPAPGGEVVEVVVSDGIITEFRRNQPSVRIPENGCVLVVSEGVNMFLANNFSVGSEIVFEYTVNPDLSTVQAAFGAGAILVSEGKAVTEFSHVVSGLQPRSAIGIDKSGTTLYLVAVNGRQDASRGMTLDELSSLMLSLGCYTAVNLDGGGSTKMVASTVWNEDLHTVNSPTENRKVINAVGLAFDTSNKDETTLHKTIQDANNTYTANSQMQSSVTNSSDIEHLYSEYIKAIGYENTGEYNNSEEYNTVNEYSNTPEEKMPFGIMLKAESNAVFIGHPVKINAAVYDENLRPINNEITFQSDKGSFEDGYFIPHTQGLATITATSENVFESIEVFVVGTVSGIDTDSHLRLEAGQAHELCINVFDNDGHYVPVNDASLFEITSSNSDVVSVSGQNINALSVGTAVIEIKKDNAKSFVTVAVGSNNNEYINNFTFSKGHFKTYPSYTGGSFELVNDTAYSGITSGKLSYDFTHESGQDVAMGAYYSLSEKPVLSDLAFSVSLRFFTETDFNHELRAQFIDANGELLIVSFGTEYETGVWQKLVAEIPDSAVRPLTLDSIYALYLPGSAKDSGNVYFDDLSFTASTPVKYQAASENVYENEQTYEESLEQFAVGALMTKPNILLSSFANTRTSDFLSSYNNSYLLGKNSGFSSHEDENALYITLDTSSGGIRNTSSTQWNSLVNAINKSGKNNIFLLSDNSVFGNNDFENRVIKDYLSGLSKNIYVISGGNRNTYKNINGVKYFTLGNNPEQALSKAHADNYKCLVFHFGDTTTFEWKKVF